LINGRHAGAAFEKAKGDDPRALSHDLGQCAALMFRTRGCSI